MANWNSHISDIITSVRAITKDQRISKRYAYNLLIDGFYEAMKNKTEYRNLMSNSNLIKKKCLDLKKVNPDCTNCEDYGLLATDVINPTTTSKGDGIIAVTSVSGRDLQRLNSVVDINNAKNRRFSRSTYYTYSEGRVYVGGKDTSTQVVVWYIPTADEIASSGADGSKCGFLQTECTIPTDIIRAVKNSAIQTIFNSIRIPLDEKPNLDNNDK